MKNLFIGIVIIAIIALIGWKAYSKNHVEVASTDTTSGATNTTTTNNTNTTVTPKPKGTSTTFKSIFAQEGNNMCEYEQSSPSGKSSHVIYIADGKMRGEFRTTVGGKTTTTLMIYTGGYLYTWTEGLATAKRTQLTTIANLPAVIPQDLDSGAVYGTKFDTVSWDCHPWNKDAKLLTLPTYLKY